MNDLEQQGDMMVEPASETIRSYILKLIVCILW